MSRAALTRIGVAALAAALPLSGCAATFDGYDLAPSGLPREEDALRRELATRPTAAYRAVLEGDVALPEDDLIRLLFAGTAGRYAGAHHESGRLLDLASYLAEDRVTVRLSEQALSMITSDRALAYTPAPHERLMIHYQAAAAYIEAGDLDAAAVEARRIEARLDRMRDEGIEVTGRVFFHDLAAEVFDAAGYPDAADVSRRRAAAASGSAAEAPLDAHVAPRAEAARDDVAPREAAGAPHGEPAPDRARNREATPGSMYDPDADGQLIVLVETGHVPHRVEQSVVIVIPSWQMTRLKDGDAGERATAALDAAARVVLFANTRFGRGGWYYRDAGYHHPRRLAPWDPCRNRKQCDDDPYLLRISWPVLYEPAAGAGVVRVRAGDVVGDATAALDVAEGARRDFEAERPTMLARTLARAVSKVALSAAAEAAVKKEDETAGRLVGLLTNLGTLLTERADTRSWHLLPGRVQMVRLTLPAGTHDLELEAGGRRIALGPVEVRAGRTTFVTHRVW